MHSNIHFITLRIIQTNVESLTLLLSKLLVICLSSIYTSYYSSSNQSLRITETDRQDAEV